VSRALRLFKREAGHLIHKQGADEKNVYAFLLKKSLIFPLYLITSIASIEKESILETWISG